MSRGFKTIVIWGVLLGVVFFAVKSQVKDREKRDDTSSLSQSLEIIGTGSVSSYSFQDGRLLLQTIDGTSMSVDPAATSQVLTRLNESQIEYLPESKDSEGSKAFTIFVIAILVLFFVFFFLRKMGGGGMGNFFEMRKSKARNLEEDDKAKFSDIGGNHEAVELLADIVDFLRAPKRWIAAGTRIPRGVLFVGPPGTGKTLLARAVAGETKSSFYYLSASEFVEMFVGVGAARVRDTFEKAAAQQPAVIFIDELDAIGRRRGSGMGTMHEEREQTLNQLLVLLDGMEKHAQLVVMAATNRQDILDPALLRSGRFDRVLQFEPPESDERIEILKIHTRNKLLDDHVSLERIAGKTDGFTGADLEALTNDAALLAIRRSRNGSDDSRDTVLLTNDDFDQAFETMVKSNRQFDRLDSVLVESVTQFAEPTGRAVARIILTTGKEIEGDVVWMNATHIKLQRFDGEFVIVGKEQTEQIISLSGTESASKAEFTPDRWAGKNLDIG